VAPSSLSAIFSVKVLKLNHSAIVAAVDVRYAPEG
jgi:hypothetical protein